MHVSVGKVWFDGIFCEVNSTELKSMNMSRLKLTSSFSLSRQ